MEASSAPFSFCMAWRASVQARTSWTKRDYGARGRSKPTNLFDLEEYIDFGLQVPNFRLVRAEYFFVFKSRCAHGDDVSFDALRGLHDSRAGRQNGIGKHRHLIQNCVLRLLSEKIVARITKGNTLR